MRMGTDAKAVDRLADWPEPVTGGKYVRMLERLVRGLRGDEAHGNRRLFLDDVVIAHLLAFFNPTLRSLRTIEDFSQTRQAQRHLSVPRLCKSTLSDFHRVADPTLLQPIIARLRALAGARGGHLAPVELPQMLAKVLAVDGSFFIVAADVAWAVRHVTNRGQSRASVRMDMHLNVAAWLPEVLDVCGHGTSEAQHAAQSVQPGAIHIYDRGIFSFELVKAHDAADAFFVHRLREAGPRSPKFQAEEARPLTDKDREAGVQSDTWGRLAGSEHRTAPDLRLREVIVASPNEPGGTLRLLTNLDVDAWVIALLYRYRWQVELFFRWLKVYANFAHLISESRAGVLLSFYVAVIGVMLLYLCSGAKPSKYAFSLLGLVASGAATLDEIAPILAERERRIALERARRARREKNR